MLFVVKENEDKSRFFETKSVLEVRIGLCTCKVLSKSVCNYALHGPFSENNPLLIRAGLYNSRLVRAVRSVVTSMHAGLGEVGAGRKFDMTRATD